MRDAGLEAAIGKAGGVGALARALGIAQPSVSSWSRIPAERVLAIEELTQVPRSTLRPDLYPEGDEALRPEIDDLDRDRAAHYSLLAVLLGRSPDDELLAELAQLRGDSTDLGMAQIELASIASLVNAKQATQEFFNLFIGVGRGELLPYASYYLTGFLNERPLARVREDFEKLGIERAGHSAEPEDHVAILMDVMAGAARGDLDIDLEGQKRFFEAHLKPWAIRFFADLETAKEGRFYRAVGRAGRVFLELEAEAFALPN